MMVLLNYLPPCMQACEPVATKTKLPCASQCVLLASLASAWCLSEEERAWAVQRKCAADEAAAAGDPACDCPWHTALYALHALHTLHTLKSSSNSLHNPT